MIRTRMYEVPIKSVEIPMSDGQRRRLSSAPVPAGIAIGADASSASKLPLPSKSIQAV